jgi:PAS domain-containing protein
VAFIAPLFPGPLDVIGDIHGELDALRALLAALGHDPRGRHPDGRRLVFIGDLCDRGPDSPGVIALVAKLVSEGRAQCLLGNHELNLLRAAPKSGNGWFFADNHDRAKGRYPDAMPAHRDQRARFQAFFATLPVALERPDLRLVHAAWQPAAIAALRAVPESETLLTFYDRHARQADADWRADPLHPLAIAEWRTWGRFLEDAEARVPLLEAMGRSDQHFQMSSPLRVATSGVERLAATPFFASGKWRMVNRVAWWNEYTDDVPVMFGHYWRWVSAATRRRFSRGEDNVFGDTPCNAWLGPRHNAFCLDFSVGVRYLERPLPPGARFEGRLGAVRWPERELVFDDGQRLPLIADPAS